MEIQDKYSWELYGQGSYLLKTIKTEDGGEVRRIVDYPLKDDNQWRFSEITEDKDGYEDTDGWKLTETEKDEIKSYIRDVLKPNDLCEENKDSWSDKYFWSRVYDGNYMLEYVENTDTRIVRHEVNYPIKGDADGWHFFTSKTINGEDMDFDSWDLPTEEQERIKSYIRNVLKPADLYEESEENKMENMKIIRNLIKPSDLYEEREEDKMENMKILNVAVPTDLTDEVMSIISRYEGVPVDKECSDDVNQAEIISLKERNEKLQEDFDDAKTVIQTILKELNGYDKDIFQPVFEACFDEESAKEYGVEKYIKQKYVVTKVRAIQRSEIEVLVLEKADGFEDAEGVVGNLPTYQIENLFSDSMDTDYSYEEIRTVVEDVTKEDIRNRYSSEELIIADDCQDVF